MPTRTRLRRTFPAIALALLIPLLATGCTAVKPVICAVTHPVNVFADRLDDSAEEDGEEHSELPTAFLLPVAVVILPVEAVFLSAKGILGGLMSGLASDLNVLVGNADWDEMNLTHAFRTNAKPPSE